MEIIGVRFNRAGKIYYFSPSGSKLNAGDKVVVETVRGLEMGTVVFGNREAEKSEIEKPLKSIARRASNDDISKAAHFKGKEEETFKTALEKIHEHNLDMKLVDVEYTFDGSKILFYFTAEGRVDFRELVRTLAGVFRTRIEFRQIGVRDESKHMGGYGVCGRHLCCSTFLDEFHPVSVKMAKEQGLSLNPTKISGVCGRLMCCLQYEQETYEQLLKVTPRVGSIVGTPDGKGVINDVSVLKGMARIKFTDNETTMFKSYNIADLKIIKNAVVKKEEKDEKISDLDVDKN
jgi:cell fate regulator YaaT (PSP1 superfamily)